MSPSPRGIRSFVALDLEGDARPALQALLERLRARGGGVAWTRPEALHLTLKFLGNVDPDCLARLGERLAAVAAAHPPFTLVVGGYGGFPTLDRPHVLWVATVAPELAALAAAVDEAAAAEGFARETRPFHPHLTLGRVRERRGRGGRAALAPVLALLRAEGETAALGVSPVRTLTLFRSDLAAAGARHSVLASWPLRGGGEGAGG